MYSASSCAAICSAVSPHCASHCWLSSLTLPCRSSAPASPASPPAPPVASHPCPPATPPPGYGAAPSPVHHSLFRFSGAAWKLPGWYTVWILVCWVCTVVSLSPSHPYQVSSGLRDSDIHPSGHAPAATPVFPSGGPAGHRGSGLHLRLTVLYPRRTPDGAGCRSGSGGIRSSCIRITPSGMRSVFSASLPYSS